MRDATLTDVFIGLLVAALFVVTVNRLLEVTDLDPAPVRETRRDFRPPIDDCPDGVPLWDCIRHAMYREDI